jgi:hypothetical protein
LFNDGTPPVNEIRRIVMIGRLAGLVLFLLPALSAAQTADWSSVPARTREQLTELRRTVAPYESPEAAREAGFRPVLGNIPTMGTHWVNIGRMRDTSRFDLATPDQLMYSTVDGREMLVGVAYAYRGPKTETPPEAFAGDLDHWHDHPELAPPGETLTMLHVWFIPSPDGPFAGHNPWLSYYALGLEPPAESALRDEIDTIRVRTLALALAEAGGATLLRQGFARMARPEVNARVENARAAIRAIVPELASASKRNDRQSWNAAADKANAEWRTIRSAYFETIPTQMGRDRLERFYEQALTGGGGHQHKHP